MIYSRRRSELWIGARAQNEESPDQGPGLSKRPQGRWYERSIGEAKGDRIAAIKTLDQCLMQAIIHGLYPHIVLLLEAVIVLHNARFCLGFHAVSPFGNREAYASLEGKREPSRIIPSAPVFSVPL
jgi:hypothetical protein